MNGVHSKEHRPQHRCCDTAEETKKEKSQDRAYGMKEDTGEMVYKRMGQADTIIDSVKEARWRQQVPSGKA
jgi:hypothetical protein